MKYSVKAVELLLKIKGAIENHFNWVEVVQNYMIISPVESSLAHSMRELKENNPDYQPCSSNERGIVLSRREDVIDGDGWKDLVKYQPVEETVHTSKKRKAKVAVSSKEREAEIITPRLSKALAPLPPKAIPSKTLPPSSSQVLKSALLIGMVYDAPQAKNIEFGQGERDRIRCKALEALGYNVETMDNKHPGQSMILEFPYLILFPRWI